MRIKTGSGNFQPCPEYNGSAVCVDVTPLKTVQTQFGPKEKFRFVFETGQTKDDGTPWCVWSAPFTPSYHENSALRPFLRKWMGRELTAEETKTFDTEDMLGKSAHITVIHEHSDGEVYANIALIQPDKAAEPLKPSGKFVRMKDRPPRDGGQRSEGGGQSGYRRTEQPRSEVGGQTSEVSDFGATKIHVGKCKGLENRLRTAKTEWDKQFAAVSGERDSLNARLTAIQIDQGVITTATKRGLRPTAIPDITARARTVFRLVEGAPRAYEADGQTVRVGRDGFTPMTLDEWVEQQVADAPHLFESNAGGGAAGNGSGGVGGSNRSVKNPFRRETWNLTEQMKLTKTDPQLAARLKAAA